MAVGFVAAGVASASLFTTANASAAASGNLTPPIPAGISNNDILVCVIHGRDNVTVTMPGDWSLLAQGNQSTTNRLTVFYKRTNGTESAPTVTHTAGGPVAAVIYAFSGAKTSGAPFNVIQGATEGEAASTTFTNAGVNNTVAGMLILAFGSQDDNSWTEADAKLDAIHFIRNQNGTDNSVGLAYGVRSTTGATGDIVITQSALGGDAGVTWSAVLEEAGSASPTLSESVTVTDTVAIEKAPAVSALTLDDTYTNGISASASTTVGVTGVTAAAGTLVVALANFSQAAGGDLPKPSIGAVAGLSAWTEIIHRAMENTTPGYGHAIAWYATCASGISSQTVTVTCNVGSTKTGVVGVYVFSDYDTTNPIGSSPAFLDSAAASDTLDVTVTAAEDASILVGSFQNGNNGSVTARANTTQDGATYVGSGSTGAVAVARQTAKAYAGANTFGYTNTDSYMLAVGVEVRSGDAATGPTLSESVAPSTSQALARSIARSLSESLTVSDVVSMARRAGISLPAESVTPSDAVAIARLLGLALTETATATDTVALSISGAPAVYEVSETATVSDAVELALVVGKSITESATATDTVALVIAAEGAASLAEVVACSEQLAFAKSIAMGLSDTVTCTDSARESNAAPVAPRTPPIVPRWWNRHRRGGKLWSG